MGIAINKMFAQLLFWLYEFLDAIFEMFRVLCGIDTVSVEGTDGGQSVITGITTKTETRRLGKAVISSRIYHDTDLLARARKKISVKPGCLTF